MTQLYKTTVVVTFQVEGAHCWEDAKKYFPEVGFLSDRHRHMFHFKVYMPVNHDDRDIEFIIFRRKVIKYLHDLYYIEDTKMYEFGHMSCEMIAKEILNEFNASKVEVWEDNENGAIIEKI